MSDFNLILGFGERQMNNIRILLHNFISEIYLDIMSDSQTSSEEEINDRDMDTRFCQ